MRKDGFANDSKQTGKRYSPPFSPFPLTRLNATIPSFTRTGYFPLLLTCSLTAEIISFFSSTISFLRSIASLEVEGETEKRERMRLTRIRVDSDRSCNSSVRLIRASIRSSGVVCLSSLVESDR